MGLVTVSSGRPVVGVMSVCLLLEECRAELLAVLHPQFEMGGGIKVPKCGRLLK